ncbi:MAG: hypothetical protein QM736_10815 [Vicinamibacterales bacterium]
MRLSVSAHRSTLGHLPGQDGTATPALIARDFGRIIDAARRQFQMNARTPAVLVGVSRGADLAVVAAGQRSLQDELGGVVAVGLTREEEYVRRRRATTALELYPYLHRLGDSACLGDSVDTRQLPAC